MKELKSDFRLNQWLVDILILVLGVAGLFFFPGYVVGEGADGDGRLITIEYPLDGWSEDRVIELRATVSDPGIQFVYLVENGVERMVRVRDQVVTEKLVLSPGTNHIILQVERGGRLYSDHVAICSQVPKKDIKVLLTWDTDGTDVDLHVENPSGEDCYYGFMETVEGGKLDVDITDGYGPEVFTQADARVGEYKVKAHYYGSHGQPQTIARVQVILFEGTDFEKKYVFEAVLVKTGDSTDIGTFNVDRLGVEGD